MKYLRAFTLYLVGFLVLLGISAPLSAHADVQDFSFSSFEADYYLSRDEDNRSKLSVTEKLVAIFPDVDQNHGIERAIPKTYDEHTVNLHVQSVTKADGTPWNYSTYSQNDNLILRIGDANRYVQGEQTYIIKYTLQDVTKNFPAGDEFFWDTNGTEWPQTFYSNNVRVHLDESIHPYFDERLTCYTGQQGSSLSDCFYEYNAASGVLTFTATDLLTAGQNMSIVVGFQPNTFAGYAPRPLTTWDIILRIVLFIVAFIWYVLVPIRLLFWGTKQWQEQGRDKTTTTTVIPQYLPAKGVSMAVSDVVIHTGMRPKAVTATIIDLAVRHYIKIHEVKKREYELELIKEPINLNEQDQQVISLLFDEIQVVGRRIALKDKRNLYTGVQSIIKKSYAAAIADGYMADTRAIQKSMTIKAGIFLALAFFTLNPLLTIVSFAVIMLAAKMPARTPAGVTLKNYLDGTKMYMQVAEAERLKFLQSPDGASDIDVNNKAQVVKLYERLLPLAILYGIEKEWAKQFAPLYENQEPNWYSGNYTAFNAAVFANAMSSFSNSTAVSNFSPPSNSGSSGFSGGGSSGGGGGGGGGGGW